ncbi:MAG: acyl-CoA dehydrogenase [Rhodospirillales bacterium]|nr:acyl-CoA dehydrogenase [Rhodospirillales bacterium]MCB9996917.1 acyl-CoA dehydrogenase [Rhodospirillales bacterium]
MSTYIPPVQDQMFILNHVIDLSPLQAVQNGDIDASMIEAVLGEAGKLAADVLAPLNDTGDKQGCVLEDGKVATPKGFKEAYATFIANGWNAVPFDPEYGGQGLPWALTFALQELWQGANMAFGLCPLLTQAGVEALHEYGTDEQKQTYLAKMISGEWTGSMQLTEPQAGTDLGSLRCTAEPQDDGSYRLRGQKIFITYGEHDFTGNIVHMVLARTPGAPEGYKGISMFLVPKFIPDAQGNPGQRNDAYCVGLEHKLGIHASPTCTMQYGDAGGAVGWLIGKENEGLKNMFIMMNNARLCVGLQGVALAERAYQKALSYAKERVQGTRIDQKDGGKVAIIEHPDVRRMLMRMKTQIEAGRALALESGLLLDLAKAGDQDAAARVNLLTPVVKAWCTDMANEVAALGVQVHGGMGFIEETGAAQFIRDARILSIYEGTNGVQAQDLYVQKLLRDKGAAMQSWIADAQTHITKAQEHKELAAAAGSLQAALEQLTEAGGLIASYGAYEGAAVSVPYLRLFGHVAGGAMLCRSALAGLVCGDDVLAESKRLSFAFYMAHILPESAGLLETIRGGSDSVTEAGKVLLVG